MAIAKGHKANFKTLQLACKNGDLALMECTDITTGEPVITICVVNLDYGEYVFTPVAKMFDGNPYDEVNPAS